MRSTTTITATTRTWTSTEREYLSRRVYLISTNLFISLIRYVDTYRDPRAEAGEEDFSEQDKKRPWWAFWRGGKSGYARASLSDFETPGDWLNTDIREGLSSMEVERRRKYSGWNELSAEKENMLIKFIGFFRGPILYGSCCC